MTNYSFLKYLSKENKEYVQQILMLTERIINKGEDIKDQKMNSYLFLLDEISELLENERLNTTNEQSGECSEEERKEIIISVFKEYDELNTYVTNLKKKIKNMVDRGLIQNLEFRQKNLRGAKIEDLYIMINKMVNQTLVEENFAPLQGLIDGESILKFIREEFEYHPLYRSFLKEEVMAKFKEKGYVVYDINTSKLDLNESIYKNGFILKENDKEKVILVIKQAANEAEIHYAMNDLEKKQKDFYFIVENQKTLNTFAKKIIFGWIGNKNPGLENKMDLTINISTLQRVGVGSIWETMEF